MMLRYVRGLYYFFVGVYKYFSNDEYRDVIGEISKCPYCMPYNLSFCDEHREKADEVLS